MKLQDSNKWMMQYNKSSKQTEIFLPFGLLIERLEIRSRFAYLFQKNLQPNAQEFSSLLVPLLKKKVVFFILPTIQIRH